MALFTQQQAAACIIKRCEASLSDGVHQYYVFRVIDEDGNPYEWRDTDLEAGADHSLVKDAIRAHLIANVEKRPAAPVKTSMIDDSIVDQTVGE